MMPPFEAILELLHLFRILHGNRIVHQMLQGGGKSLDYMHAL